MCIKLDIFILFAAKVHRFGLTSKKQANSENFPNHLEIFQIIWGLGL